MKSAWEQYNDAELGAAKEHLRAAYEALVCQEQVVSSQELLDLYRLDALVSLTGDDAKGVTYATIRAVAAQHEGARPGEGYGPELAIVYDNWVARLSSSLVNVTIDGGGAVWVDGRPAPLQVVQGEHLIQVDTGRGVSSQMVELTADLAVPTGVRAPEVASSTEVPVAPSPAVVDLDVATTSARVRRRRPALLWLGGLLSSGAGAFALATGYRSELAFHASDYYAAGWPAAERSSTICGRGEACYASAREAAIRTDAGRIRLAYALGYGLTGVGAGMLTVSLVGLPAKGDARSITIRARF